MTEQKDLKPLDLYERKHLLYACEPQSFAILVTLSLFGPHISTVYQYH
jgi:hypothetical protein